MTCSLLKVGNPSKKSSIDSPALRASKSVWIGTLVIAKTCVPPRSRVDSGYELLSLNAEGNDDRQSIALERNDTDRILLLDLELSIQIDRLTTHQNYGVNKYILELPLQ